MDAVVSHAQNERKAQSLFLWSSVSDPSQNAHELSQHSKCDKSHGSRCGVSQCYTIATQANADTWPTWRNWYFVTVYRSTKRCRYSETNTMNKAFEDSTIEIRCILHRQRMADGFSTPKLPFKFLVNQRFNLDVIDIILTVIIYRVKPRHRPLHQELEGQFWCWKTVGHALTV